MIYLRFQTILSIGLIVSTSAEINLDQVINYLSSKNLPKAQIAFHNCIAKFNVKGLEQTNYEEINTFLCKLRDNIISREMDPNEMSQKLVEYLKLDKSIITKHFDKCCTDFHSRLFTLENLGKSDNLETFAQQIYTRFDGAYKILQDCVDTYSLSGYYTQPINRYETHRERDKKHKFCIRTAEFTIKFITSDYTLNEVASALAKNIFSILEKPFEKYCFAVYYTYLVLDDSVLTGLIQSASAEINLDRVINYLSTTNLPKAQDAFHNCIANLNIKRLEKMNYEEINKILYKLRDDLISRKIEPNEMSQKLVEFLKLDKSIITKKFNECCTIFHSRLFAVEKPQISDNLETFKELLKVRFYGAYKILQDCIDMYSLVELDKSEINFYETTKSNSKQYNSQKSTINIMMNINSVDYTVDRVIDQLKFSYFGDVEKPFAMYCCAVHYTYLVSDDSNLKQSLGTSDRSQ
ncbi:uncharacterized protein LOC126908616 [Daktulosphaira vitifoliae]|uniref:uncharacterized protein LOC126908616 n=1 Tax=Daktulosphaira vitifoliae TaxID=58002 RepID=UPI0021AAB006|nr:uncharacterized protein LOC126908616 [Daktulosphaira vitifoliae]